MASPIVIPFPGQPETSEPELVSEVEVRRSATHFGAAIRFTSGEECAGRDRGEGVLVPPRWVLGQAVVVGQGFGSWAHRGWDGATLGVYRRQMRVAEAAGDLAVLAEWTERRQRALTTRHKRLMDLPRLARNVVLVVAESVAGVVLLLVAGLLAWHSGVGSVLGPISAALTVTGWLITVVAYAWTPALVLAPVWVVFAAWRVGHRRGTGVVTRRCSPCRWVSPRT